MSAAAATVADELAAGSYGYSTRLLDSGGGRGRRGYAAFPGAAVRVARADFDVLHLHVASGGSVARKAILARLATRRQIPYVVHLHGGGFGRFLERLSSRQRRRVTRFFAQATCVVVLGEGWAQLVREELRVPDHRLAVVPNGVPGPVEVSRASERERMVLFLGGIGPAKGVDVLLDAIEAHWSDENWRGWSFLFVGPESDRATADRVDRISRRDPNRVCALGPLYNDDKKALWRRAAVFVLPSRMEGLPLVVLEAMSHGTPVVATDVGAVRETIDRAGAGLVVPPGDADSLGAALARLMDAPVLRDQLGSAGRAAWERDFTMKVMVSRLTKVWDQARARRDGLDRR